MSCADCLRGEILLRDATEAATEMNELIKENSVSSGSNTRPQGITFLRLCVCGYTTFQFHHRASNKPEGIPESQRPKHDFGNMLPFWKNTLLLYLFRGSEKYFYLYQTRLISRLIIFGTVFCIRQNDFFFVFITFIWDKATT